MMIDEFNYSLLISEESRKVLMKLTNKKDSYKVNIGINDLWNTNRNR